MNNSPLAIKYNKSEDNRVFRALVLTGGSPRHIYFANKMSQAFDVVGLISEPKGDYFRAQRDQSSLIKTHFESLNRVENKYFSEFKTFPQVATFKVKPNQINESDCFEWASKKDVDVVLLFGTGILGETWLSKYKSKIVNLHLGVSPRYRGSATLFWPFFNDELQFVGSTVHLASSSLDGGDILQTILSDYDAGENYYDMSFKIIKKSIEIFPNIILDFLLGRIIASPQKQEERKYYYRKADFNEKALKYVLEKYS